MVRLSQDAFLSELTRLFRTANTANSGSVQLCFKPYSPAADAAERAAAAAASGKASSSKKQKGSSSKKKKGGDAMSDVESDSGSVAGEVRPEDEPVLLLTPGCTTRS